MTIWDVDNILLTKIVSNSLTFVEILRQFGIVASGSTYRTLKRRLKADNISYTHIAEGLGASRGRCNWKKPPIPADELFVENSTHQRCTIKRYIIKNNLISYKCALCPIISEWNGKPLVLRLDHINGKRDDHRLDNLRFVCPNCDSQLDTYGSKNNAKRYNCIDCGIKISPKSKRCNTCAGKLKSQRRKVVRPAKNELLEMVWEIPTTTVASKLGVTDNAVAKWCKSYGITKPGPGYWMKIK